MEPRLFDLDLQLIADSILMILAVLVLFSFCLIPVLIVRLVKKNNKTDCNSCPYQDNNTYH